MTAECARGALARSVFALLIALVPFVAAPQTPAQAPAPPDTEIFLASLTTSGGRLVIGRPTNVTNSPGYDNQPSFTPDGRAMLFTSIRGGRQTDIYRYDLASAATTRVTDTPESEYSPTVTPDGAHISVVRVEADGTQRLWQFTIDGREPTLLLRDVKPVGYHAWTGPTTLALYVLGSPATLQVADTTSGRAEIVARDIARSLQPIPSSGRVSFVAREDSSSASPRLSIRELDPKTHAIAPLVAAPAGAREADVAWAPDGLLLVAKDDVLYGWRRGDAEWHQVAKLKELGLRGVSRMAVSPAGDRLALVASP
jgi:WD40-like Beta Propeller Repeat